MTTVHERRKAFQCDLCEKAFANQGNLKRHIASVHEGKKDFQCQICEKTFAWQQGLKVHTDSVHEGRRFSCEICEKKTFSQHGDVKRHIKLWRDRIHRLHMHSQEHEG